MIFKRIIKRYQYSISMYFVGLRRGCLITLFIKGFEPQLALICRIRPTRAPSQGRKKNGSQYNYNANSNVTNIICFLNTIITLEMWPEFYIRFKPFSYFCLMWLNKLTLSVVVIVLKCCIVKLVHPCFGA
jgi:hypothetical protein